MEYLRLELTGLAHPHTTHGLTCTCMGLASQDEVGPAL